MNTFIFFVFRCLPSVLSETSSFSTLLKAQSITFHIDLGVKENRRDEIGTSRLGDAQIIYKMGHCA